MGKVPGHIEAFIFDIDGCVAIGDRPIPGALEALARLMEQGKGVAFFTNDSILSSQEWTERMRGMGFQFPGKVITAGDIMAELARRRYPQGKVLLIGGKGVVPALEERGLTLVSLEEAMEADVVLLGRDPDFNYQKLKAACRAIWGGAGFITVSMARMIPAKDGPVPGTGSTAMAVIYATKKRPLVAGKPSPWAGRFALKLAGFAPAKAAFVGDDLELENAMAKRLKIYSILVLSGNTKAEYLPRIPERLRPDMVLKDVTELT